MDSSLSFSRPIRFRASGFDVKLALSMGTIVVIVMALAVVAEFALGIDHWDLMRDPNAIAQNPHYFGIISNLGIVLWIAAATGAFQAYAALGRKRFSYTGSLLFYGALFATLMGLDDFLMLHESVEGATGLPEPVILIPHAILLALTCYHGWILRTQTPFIVLAAMVAAFALSFAFDLYSVYFTGQIFLEEGFKLLGIAMLAAYLVVVGQGAMRMLRSEIA